ncbi:MAG: metallophosphoesterase [Candidatus Thermoplasmatota archaeon]|nr:metallophosphoesterase [Candidatus Thermoplasmatota archaeon]
MIIEPVPDIPALLIKGAESWVCVADLHIGIEVQLRRAGFNVPSQTSKMADSIERLAKEGDSLVLLGDVKHRIPAVSHMENKEIPAFIARLRSSFKRVVVVAGNHDGGLSHALPEGIEAVSGAGTLLEEVGMVHGHVWPSERAMSGGSLIMGHIHPSVMLMDSIGAKTNEKCWVRARMKRSVVRQRYDHCPKEVVVVPAFNPLLVGTPINGGRGGPLGPIFRNGLVDQSSMSAYLLDGTNLGRPRAV